MKKLWFILFLSCFFNLTHNARAQDFIKLEGKIISSDTKEPVPYAAIGFPEKGLGTICDENGNFELKIPNDYKSQEICVSALGFKQSCRPIAGFSAQNPTVLLEPANIELAAVEIKALSAIELVKEAIRRIPENYADKPVRYTFYQQQTEEINNKPAYLIESVNEAYLKHPKNEYQLMVLKSRGMAKGNNKERMNKTRISFYDIMSASDLNDYRDFLKIPKMNDYQYTFEKQDLIGNDTVYIIVFKPRAKSNSTEKAGTEGQIFLHHKSKAIVRLEIKENNAALNKLGKNMIVKIASKISDTDVTFQAISSQLVFKQFKNRWYLSQILSEGIILKNSERFEKPEKSHQIRQIVVTQIQVENAPEIPEEQRVKPYDNPYSTALKDMNESFWQRYNVLPLPEAYKNTP